LHQNRDETRRGEEAIDLRVQARMMNSLLAALFSSGRPSTWSAYAAA